MEKTELLMKLIALANNNPNDNEANLAARKVCVMLAEMKVNFIKKSPIQQQRPRPEPSFWGFDNDIIEIMKNMAREQANYRPPPRYNPFSGNPFRDGPSWTEPKEKKAEPPKPKVTRECADCHKKVMAKDNGGIFYCNTCQWRRHEENKAKERHR